MPEYWIDTSCLIEPYRTWYRFKIVPGYWEFLESGHRSGLLGSSQLVLRELEDGGLDELVEWARRQEGFFVEHDKAVQVVVGDIGAYVRSLPYEEAIISKFMDGADPWLIAHARIHGGTIVTQENRSRANVEPKIPVIAEHYGLIEPVTAQQLLQSLNVQFR